MKIIKCDSSRDITFLDIESDNKKFKNTKIIRFVRDTLRIRLSDNSGFYYEIINPLCLKEEAKMLVNKEIIFSENVS